MAELRLRAMNDEELAAFREAPWVALSEPPRPGAWIYAIEVDAAVRGKGYGRALLAALEDRVREHGVATIGLNVFGENHVARRLYESAGYETTSLQMRKTV